MDTSHESQTPTTPAFPQELPTATSSNPQTPTQSPFASTTSYTGNSSINSSSFDEHPAACSHTPMTMAAAEGTRNFRHPTLHSRRALRRRQHKISLVLSYQARHHCRFIHLLRPLQPLVSIETGRSHPYFPRNMLQYHLLSHAQLDALADHYHQSVPSYYSLKYPTTVVGRWWALSLEDGDLMVRDQHFEALMEEARGILKDVSADSLGAPMTHAESEDGNKEGKIDVQEKAEEDEKIEARRKATEMIIEGKRRRFGRFIGLRDCESPGAEDERVMERAMDAWVWGEVERRMQMEGEWEVGVGKGGW